MDSIERINKCRSNSSSIYSNYLDYYPFGMVMPGRQYTSENLTASGSYRYGFNGMEKDGEEWMGSDGNQLDFGARIYDSRLARWLNSDFLEAKFSWLSPMAFGSNKPIVCIDYKGNDIVYYGSALKSLKPKVEKLRSESVTFNIILNYLENSNNLYRVGFDHTNTDDTEDKREGKSLSDAKFIPSKQKIVFSDPNEKNNVILEEFFHAFQFDFYGGDQEVRKNYSIAHIESEAKLLTFLIEKEELKRNEFWGVFYGDYSLVALNVDLPYWESSENLTFYTHDGTYQYFTDYLDNFIAEHKNDNYSSGGNTGMEPAALNYLITKRNENDVKSKENRENRRTSKPAKPTYDGKVPKKNR